MDKKILFIGSFILPKNGHYGGVYFASTSLSDKLLFEEIEVIELDTTLKDITITKVSKRISHIILRNFYFFFKILFSPKAKSLFVFVSRGNSYLDKFPSILLARVLRKKIYLFPISGHIIEDFDKPIYNFFIKKTLKFSNIIICQSSFWQNYFLSKDTLREKLIIIENWVPKTIISNSEKLTYSAFNKNNKKTFKIVYVSRIEVAKGITDLIEVIKLLPKTMEYHIDVYGEGSFKNDFLKTIKEKKLENIIKYKGWLDKCNMQETLNSYHLALFTSRVEGYPNSLLDFIFSKVPIIAYDIPAVKAVGKDHLLYYNDINTLAYNISFSYNNYDEVVSKNKELYSLKVKQNNIDYAFNQLENI